MPARAYLKFFKTFSFQIVSVSDPDTRFFIFIKAAIHLRS